MTGARNPAKVLGMRSLIALVVMILCSLIQQAHGHPPLSRIGLLDARRPDAAVAVAPEGPSHRPESQFAFLPLEFTGTPARVGCCLQLDGSIDSDWMQQDQTLHAERARFTSPRPETGFAGLVLPVGTVVTRQRGSRLWLRWPGGGSAVQVRYCNSAEGLHVTLQEEGRHRGRQAVRAYYLDLGMDLIPNCPHRIAHPPTQLSPP
jgi:hypothetical protein